MELGVVREVTPQERRVAVTPEGTRTLVALGHGVVVESNAGLGSGFTDTEYLAAGGQLAFSAREVAGRVEALVKIHAPRSEEYELVRPSLTLLGFLHLANAPRGLHAALREAQATTFSLELV